MSSITRLDTLAAPWAPPCRGPGASAAAASATAAPPFAAGPRRVPAAASLQCARPRSAAAAAAAAAASRARASDVRARMAPNDRDILSQAYIDLVNNLTGGGGAGSMRALEDLRDKIGSEVYIDIAGWHLYLRDTKYAQELAVAVFKKIDDAGRYDERDLDDILRAEKVSLGQGKSTLTLADVIPEYSAQDLRDIVEDFARELGY